MFAKKSKACNYFELNNEKQPIVIKEIICLMLNQSDSKTF